MKFLLVNHEYPPVGGGAATASHEIAHNLVELGNEAAVLTSRFGDLPGFAVEEAVAVHRVTCLRRRIDRSGIFEMLTFMIGALCSLPFILTRRRPDALLVFFSLPSGIVGLAAKVFAHLPYVVSLRGGDVPGLVPGLDRLHKLLAPLRRCVLMRAEAVIANSEGLRTLSERADRLPVQVIPNGVDTDFFRPGPEHQSERLRLLFVGRFHEQKNLRFLLEQIVRLPAGAIEVHLVGDGPQREELRALAQQLGFATQIIWHGWLSRTALLAVYQSADFLVNPSFYEGMPNVVLEAMACGLPVVASNLPGNNELVVNGETGFLFELHGNPDEFSAVLNRLRDVDLRRQLGGAARARAINCFSWRNAAAQYAELFASPTA